MTATATRTYHRATNDRGILPHLLAAFIVATIALAAHGDLAHAAFTAALATLTLPATLDRHPDQEGTDQ